jgi:cytohesin
LENLEVKECHDVKRPNCFEIISSVPIKQYNNKGTIKACKTTGQGKVVTGNHQVYRIQASSKEEMDEWMKRIKSSIASNPFIEMLQQKRQKVSNRGPIIL